jgi:beta-phosphoglucomutase
MNMGRSRFLLQAVVFDFDGIIVDSEPLIARVYQQMAEGEGWNLTTDEYYRDYLALDDRAAIEHLFRSHGKELSWAQRNNLLDWKAKTYLDAIRSNGLPPLPGAVEFVRQCSSQVPLAIASGSLRHEVEYLLARLQLQKEFAVISTADDCERSKPDPEVYLNALAGLRQSGLFPGEGLEPSRCLAIEDAPAGVQAAQAAGLKCVAVAHSRPPEELLHADWVFQCFAEVRLNEIAESV